LDKLQSLWKAVVDAAAPYMQNQLSDKHFEFFGLDIIADTDHCCWLIEINR
jgi:hypothetical protein